MLFVEAGDHFLDQRLLDMDVVNRMGGDDAGDQRRRGCAGGIEGELQLAALAGDDAHLKASDLKVVQALLGRSEAHPTKVLTGNEWLQYFDKVASDDEESDGEGFNQRMRVDSKTGLDMII